MSGTTYSVVFSEEFGFLSLWYWAHSVTVTDKIGRILRSILLLVFCRQNNLFVSAVSDGSRCSLRASYFYAAVFVLGAKSEGDAQVCKGIRRESAFRFFGS